MKREQLAADAALLFVAAVWGGTFVMVQDAVRTFPVVPFLALRFFLATMVLLPFAAPSMAVAGPSPKPPVPGSPVALRALAPGMLVGLALFVGYAFQTFGLRYTTPAKAGFITGLSVVLVPMGQSALLRRPPGRGAIAGVALATCGLALLSLEADLSVGLGDLLVLCCAVAFAAHILLVGRFAPHWSPQRLALVQVATVAVLSGLVTLVLPGPLPKPTGNVWLAAAFTGVLATSLAFFLQSRAQQATTPTHTALIFAAEPVFAGLFSFLLVGEVLGMRQVTGCLLILAGMVAAELKRLG